MSDKVHLTNSDVTVLADNIAEMIPRRFVMRPQEGVYHIYGVPRGGIAPAFAVVAALERAGRPARVVDDPAEADVIVDDLIDSGATRDSYAARYPNTPFVALVSKIDRTWLVFPWEAKQGADESATDIPVRLLQYIGEDPARGGLLETPARFLKAWDYWTKGYAEDPGDIMKVFEDGGENYDQMVLVRDIPVYSKCEHHLADIFGVAHVAYIPNGKIVGLSKLSRVVDIYARRLQVQERLTGQIAQALEDHLQPLGVAVMLRCRHMCMESRGICQQGHSTVTTALRGVFRDDPAAKDEFLRQVVA